MSRKLVLLGTLLIAACGSDPQAAGDVAEPACTGPGTHQSVLTTNCLSQIKAQLVARPSTFFIVRLDEAKNHFVQAAHFPDGAFILEVPGPKFASMEPAAASQLRKMGFALAPDSGNYAAMVAPAALEDGRLEEIVLTVAKSLGYPEGSAMTYQVDPLAMPE